MNPAYYVNKAKKTTFAGQFANKSLDDAFEAKKDVDAIASSTITSRSISVLVRTAGKAAAVVLKEGTK
jgi:Na+-translocating ferredoxin:NAD+ oxidoreductase subunit G